MNITEFLEARIAEDEREAGSGWSTLGDGRWERDNYGRNMLTPSAVLAECAAKREIIQQHPGDSEGYCYDPVMHQRGCQWTWPCPTLTALAAVYKDHPDYRQEWAVGG
jgi:hypothetical protein